MKYYVNGERISEEKALEIEKKNNEFLNSGNLEELKNIEFIVKIK